MDDIALVAVFEGRDNLAKHFAGDGLLDPLLRDYVIEQLTAIDMLHRENDVLFAFLSGISKGSYSV